MYLSYKLEGWLGYKEFFKSWDKLLLNAKQDIYRQHYPKRILDERDNIIWEFSEEDYQWIMKNIAGEKPHEVWTADDWVEYITTERMKQTKTE